MKNKLNILIICDFDLKFNITTIIDLTILLLPSRLELENHLSNYKYDCIIPLISKSDVFDYDLYHILEIYECNVFGNRRIKNLIINEKTTYFDFSNSKGYFEIWTRYNYKQNLKNISLNDFPVFIEYSTSKNDEKILISETKKFYQFVENVFTSKNNVEEIILWKQYSFDEFIDIAIWGNTPYTFETVSGRTKNISALISAAYEYFRSFALENFVLFKFGIQNNKYFLLDVKCSNSLSSKQIELVLNLYNITFMEFIYLCVLLCFTKNRSNPYDSRLIDLASELPNNINHLIPLELKIKNNKYSYNDICKELRTRLLKPDESNKQDFLKMTALALKNIPPTKPNSYYLGELDYNYNQILSKYKNIPKHPQNEENVLLESIKILNGQIKWHSPLTLYNVCSPVMMSTIAATTVTNMFNPNGMIKDTSAGYLTMEKQIIKQLSNLVGINENDSAGVFVAGGKVCLTYGIKCGLNRCQRACGFSTEPVVITSDSNHFSIESICFQLGMDTEKCIRIPLIDNQTLNLSFFKDTLEECFNKNIPIASVIISGGNTMHASVESIKATNNIIDELVKKYKINYKPYIYYDMVVCWPWLFFKSYDFEKNPLLIESDALLKIKHTSDLFKYSHLADGFGFDFHKCGFSPYTTSVFLTKSKKDLYSINQKNESSEKDSCYYTFTNSRCTTDIISAWNVLQSVGVEGFQSYVANMISVANTFSKNLSNNNILVVGDEYTYGFGTIILSKSPILNCNFEKLLNSSEYIKINNEYMFGLSEYFKNNNTTDLCVRYLPNYMLKNRLISVITVFPITINIDTTIAQKISKDIIEIKKIFDEKCLKEHKICFGDAPIDVPR